MTSRTSTTLLAALLLVLTACGSGGDTAEGDSSGDEETLSDFFGGPDFDADPAAAEADFREQEARVQEAIRQCMAEQGFEYEPMMPPEDSFQVMDEMDEEERVKTEGFGMTTWYGREEEFEEEAMEWEDPNQERVEAMSDSERQAWQDALWGTEEEQEAQMTTEVNPDTGEEEHMMTGFGAGCEGKAYEQEFGEQAGGEELWQELEPAFIEMDERIQADPRIVEANEAWAGCMAERGHDYESQEDMWESMEQDFMSRMDELTGGGMGGPDPFEGWTDEEIEAFFEESTDEELDAFFQEQEQAERENVDMEAVAALQQEEIDLAVADFECREGMDEVYEEVRAEYEAEFIEANRDKLEEIREAQE